jgi:hypothetical protein
MMGASVEIFVVKRGPKPRVVPPSAVASRGDTLVIQNYTREDLTVSFDDTEFFRVEPTGPVPPGGRAQVTIATTPERFGVFVYSVRVGPVELPIGREFLSLPGEEVEVYSSPEVIIRR